MLRALPWVSRDAPRMCCQVRRDFAVVRDASVAVALQSRQRYAGPYISHAELGNHPDDMIAFNLCGKRSDNGLR